MLLAPLNIKSWQRNHPWIEKHGKSEEKCLLCESINFLWILQNTQTFGSIVENFGKFYWDKLKSEGRSTGVVELIFNVKNDGQFMPYFHSQTKKNSLSNYH